MAGRQRLPPAGGATPLRTTIGPILDVASVLAIGGFTGSDDYPTLAQFQAYVRAARSTTSSRAADSGREAAPTTAQQITRWVTGHFTATTIGGQTGYDLRGGA